MRVSYNNRCFEITEAWIVDGFFRFKTVNGNKICGIELEDNYNYRDNPITVLCSNGYVILDNYAKKTTTVAELQVYGSCEKKREDNHG